MKSSELKTSKMYIAIAKLLKDGRKQSGRSLDYIEEKTGVNRNQLWCYENNTREPSTDELLALLEVYGFELRSTIEMINELRKR